MFGYRARIGLIIPAANTVLEPEFYRIVPEGVTIHSSRVYNRRADLRDTFGMARHIERAAKELSVARPSVIVFGCTTGSLVGGSRYDREIIDRIVRVAGVPSTTTSTAVLHALKELRLKKISVATPYIEDLNLKEKEFLEENGFDVLTIEGLNILDAFEIGVVSPYKVYSFAKGAIDPDSDGLFISCTNLRTLEVIRSLEEDLGKPVVSSNQATIWASLRMSGVKDVIEGYGSLLHIKKP